MSPRSSDGARSAALLRESALPEPPRSAEVLPLRRQPGRPGGGRLTRPEALEESGRAFGSGGFGLDADPGAEVEVEAGDEIPHEADHGAENPADEHAHGGDAAVGRAARVRSRLAASGAAGEGEDKGAAADARLAAWIHRIARQDERALEALYDATAGHVHGVVLRITQRTALAEEVVEETFWQVWRQAPRFDAERGRPVTWLLAMARSRAIDMLRREHRHRHDELPEEGVADFGLAGSGAADSGAPPQDLLEATRGHAHVHAALASLEPRARQLVALAFFRGLTHEEIAEQQGLPLGTVKSMIRRALQQLKRVMEAEHA